MKMFCYLRYPGRELGADEMPPVALVSIIPRQLGVSPAAFTKLGSRFYTTEDAEGDVYGLAGFHQVCLVRLPSFLRTRYLRIPPRGNPTLRGC